MIPRFSVKNPVLINMIMILIVACGIISGRSISLEAFPQVDLQYVSVLTLYPKASPSDVEEKVTKRIETEIKDMEEIDDYFGSSMEGRSVVVLVLKADIEDLDKVVSDVQNRVSRAQLPREAEDPHVDKLGPSFPVMNLAVSGSTDYAILKEISEELREALLEIEGVTTVALTGLRDREVWVEVDRDKLEHYGLTISQIMGKIRNRNLNQPGGSFKGEAEEVRVRTVGEIEAAAELEEIGLLSNERGHTVPLSEVSTIRDTYEDAVTFGHVDGNRSINVRVEKNRSGNSIQIGDSIKALIREFNESVDPNINVSVAFDGTQMIRARLNVLVNSGILGFGLVILVLYMALARKISNRTVGLIAMATVIAVILVRMLDQELPLAMMICGIYVVLVLFIMMVDLNGRISLMAGLGIPVSIMFALILMYGYGTSLNMISMFGLIVVLGMLVDDGIVVTENVYRHMQMGKSRQKAAIDGAKEVFMPVNAAILTSVAAFLPMLLMEGILGKFMMWIPIVVIFALLGSLVESFLILPSHLADFGLPNIPEKEKNSEKRWFRSLRGFYTWLLTKILRRRYVFVPCTILVAVLIVGFGFKALGFKLFPDLNLDRFTLSVKAPVGVKLEETERVISEIELQAGKLPREEWESILARIGEVGRGPERSIATNIGQVTVNLVDADRRDRSGEEIISAFRKSLKTEEGVTVEVVRGRTGPPTGPPIQIRIRGEDLERLREVGEEVEAFLTSIEGVKYIYNDYDTGKSEEHVVIDETRAKELGVDVLSVAETVRFAYEGGLATEILRGDEDIDVVVRLAPEFRRNVNDLMALTVRRNTGALVPMENVVSILPRRGPVQINRYNGKRCVTVRADVESDVITSFAVNNQVREKFGSTIGSDVFLSYSGEDEDRKKSMDSLMAAFWVALLLIYMILGTLFRSFIQPLVVLFTIPLGLIGVIYGLFIHGQPMSLMAMIGVVALSGVVVNDSLVFVDFINRLRSAGVPRLQAIIRSGRHRLRPILLTTATTVVGLMPLMFEVTGSAAFLTPMAISIVWGLLFATFLLLLFIPALYLIVDDVRWWLKKVFAS